LASALREAWKRAKARPISDPLPGSVVAGAGFGQRLAGQAGGPPMRLDEGIGAWRRVRNCDGYRLGWARFGHRLGDEAGALDGVEG
jgi:hypothetical protein